jgi:hypothetical protein
MRKGQNPAKMGTMPPPKAMRLGIATVLYIPEQSGYFAQSLEIFKIHAASLRQYTSEPFNYLVFDNGSCAEVRQELLKMQLTGQIDWLYLSDANLGKTGAMNLMLAGMPNEWICFSDSDMLFRPNWLPESWKIEQAFPNLGMIGAHFVFPDVEVDKGNTHFRQTSDPRFCFDQWQPEAWMVDEYCRARGIGPEKTREYLSKTLERVEAVESGTRAILGGNSHTQWLARKEVIQRILPLPADSALSRKDDTYQDRRLDELGYLHLTTTQPYLYHMGNTLDPEILPEIAQLTQLTAQPAPAAPRAKAHPVWKLLAALNRRPAGRRLLLRLYDNLYQVLSS